MYNRQFLHVDSNICFDFFLSTYRTGSKWMTTRNTSFKMATWNTHYTFSFHPTDHTRIGWLWRSCCFRSRWFINVWLWGWDHFDICGWIGWDWCRSYVEDKRKMNRKKKTEIYKQTFLLPVVNLLHLYTWNDYILFVIIDLLLKNSANNHQITFGDEIIV